MKFSIIIPSFNQHLYIEKTIINLRELKTLAATKGIDIELILIDNLSVEPTKSIIHTHKDLFDYLLIEKDSGQYDAINKGIQKCTGDYWTWLNTDDLIDTEGFFKLAALLESNKTIDYIYGGVTYINEHDNVIKTVPTWKLTLDELVKKEPAIFQPGSFFKKSFTDKIGLLKSYACCFDYEYILRLLKHHAVFYNCDFPVSQFRYYSESKTGSNTVQFIKEQLIISKAYGRKWFHYLTGFSNLRLLKHLIFPRK